MKIMLELSRQNIDLSIEEAATVFCLKHPSIIDKYIFLNSTMRTDALSVLFKRLAYTRFAYQVIFSVPKNQLGTKVKNYDFNTIIKKSYKIFYEHIGDEKLKEDINSIVWNNLMKPKVDLKKPFHELYFIGIGRKIYCALKIYQNKNDFDSRAPHKRLGLRPISMHPRLARCLVNLAGTTYSTICDAFTGTSGILIEGMLCGQKVEGYDISDVMLRISEANFKQMGFDPDIYKLENRDFFKLKRKINYLVTDLPYGKNTKNISYDFYEKFLIKLDKILVKRGVVVVPEIIDIKRIFRKTKVREIRLVKTFYYYVHCSMSRVICVIEKKNAKNIM